MRANCTWDIKRDLATFDRIVREALQAGKIDEATAMRQFDASTTVEMALPTFAYSEWNWTPEAKENLRKIRAFLAKRRAA